MSTYLNGAQLCEHPYKFFALVSTFPGTRSSRKLHPPEITNSPLALASRPDFTCANKHGAVPPKSEYTDARKRKRRNSYTGTAVSHAVTYRVLYSLRIRLRVNARLMHS